MKLKIQKTLLAAGAFALILPLAGCRVEQTEKGAMPDVEVDVDGGNLPKYDVDGPDVDVGTKTIEVKTPDVDVTLPGDPDYEKEKQDEGEEGGR